MINDTLHHHYIDKNTGTLDSKTMAQHDKKHHQMAVASDKSFKQSRWRCSEALARPGDVSSVSTQPHPDYHSSHIVSVSMYVTYLDMDIYIYITVNCPYI